MACGGNSSLSLGSDYPPPPTSARRVGHRLEGTRASRRVGSLHPGGGAPGQPPGTLCRRRPRLWGFRTAGRALILKPVPSAQPPPREVPHSEPCCGQEGVGDHAGGTPRRPRGQAFLGPGLRLKLNVDLSLVHKHFFIHPLLLPGGH